MKLIAETPSYYEENIHGSHVELVLDDGFEDRFVGMTAEEEAVERAELRRDFEKLVGEWFDDSATAHFDDECYNCLKKLVDKKCATANCFENPKYYIDEEGNERVRP